MTQSTLTDESCSGPTEGNSQDMSALALTPHEFAYLRWQGSICIAMGVAEKQMPNQFGAVTVAIQKRPSCVQPNDKQCGTARAYMHGVAR